MISAFRKAPPDTDRYATGTTPEKTTQESLVPTETNGGKGFSAFFWISDFVENGEFIFWGTEPPSRPVKGTLSKLVALTDSGPSVIQTLTFALN